MVVTIDVTAEDIAEGKQIICTACPVARAINRRLAPGWEAAVGSGEYVLDPETWSDHCSVEGLLPPAASEFILAFDLGRPVAPFSFQLDLPDYLLRAEEVPA